jgi:hypothetical protein
MFHVKRFGLIDTLRKRAFARGAQYEAGIWGERRNAVSAFPELPAHRTCWRHGRTDAIDPTRTLQAMRDALPQTSLGRGSSTAAGFVEGSLTGWSRVALRRGCSTIAGFLMQPLQRLPEVPSPPLLANERDDPLIDRSSIPCLDSSEIGFAGLVPRARLPAIGPEEICRRGQRVAAMSRLPPVP